MKRLREHRIELTKLANNERQRPNLALLAEYTQLWLDASTEEQAAKVWSMIMYIITYGRRRAEEYSTLKQELEDAVHECDVEGLNVFADILGDKVNATVQS